MIDRLSVNLKLNANFGCYPQTCITIYHLLIVELGILPSDLH